MVSINYATREVTCKIVYYGPGLSGKTTNLQYIHDKVPGNTRGKMISLATEADRTLYFDFLPINIGQISGLTAKFQLYTVPGQVYYNATRKLVLRGADGLVFVADSQADKMDENIESINNMKENLEEYGYDIKDMPIVIQYNKRDLPNVLSVEELEEKLNPYGWKHFEASAVVGTGVFDTLKMSIKIVLDKARHGDKGTSSTKQAGEPEQVEVQAAAAEGGGAQPPSAATPPVETAADVAAAPVKESEAVREAAYDAEVESPTPVEEYENGNGDVGKTTYEAAEIKDNGITDTEPFKEQAPAAEEPEMPMEADIVSTSQESYQEIPEKEPEAEDDGPDWGQDRPFPGSTSKIARRGRRITVSDFQPISDGDSSDEGDGSADGDADSYAEWQRPTMAPSTRVKKKKRGFFKRLFGIK